MSNNDLLSQFSTAIDKAKTILVVIPGKPKFDEVAAGLGLYLALKKEGKQAFVVCPDEMTARFSSLVGIDKVEKSFFGKKENLLISFDYKEEKVDKVSYNIEDSKFNLIIKPRQGELPLDKESVRFSYTGGKPDLIITINALPLEQVKKLCQTQDEISAQLIVNIGYFDSRQPVFLNLVDKNIASVCELITGLISRLGFVFDQDIATNLLAGIEEATRMFSSRRVNSNTFEMAALCLKYKARRRVFTLHEADGAREKRVEEKKEKKEIKFPQRKEPEPEPDQQILQPEPTAKPAEKPAEEQEDEEAPSPDWLAPKIYKGNTRV